MKVLVTGASGILGGDFVKKFKVENWETVGYGAKDIDITNFSEVKKKTVDYKPDLIVHCAAMTNVDLCETDHNAALKANVIATQNYSVVANLINSRIVYISSCGVYGKGKTEPYTEFDKPHPVNFHHYTKLQGEEKIKEHNNDFLIIRPGWLYGGSREHKKNFVEARRREAANNPVIKSAVDKIGSPTYTLDLVNQVIALIKEEMAGTFNIVNPGTASRFDYVSAIVDLLKMNIRVEKTNSNDFPRHAPMPDNEALLNTNLELHGMNQMRDWTEALADYIQHSYTL